MLSHCAFVVTPSCKNGKRAVSPSLKKTGAGGKKAKAVIVESTLCSDLGAPAPARPPPAEAVARFCDAVQRHGQGAVRVEVESNGLGGLETGTVT
ncbi:uncharacterized protein N7484_006720 [Penicillium longicatenatum]|uniref:uncharacterized protein n=1 Tax=Penicillium longicatenatum TaxID=1561947 RepID=UPI0025473C98|nr:uncharacterized protein N7484_006720 [Penicillium longicatenatum]KAJ5644213.1 hypothetical protein N7484_006720 [Penicillium longicatenatum]